jgi:tetratricopeptide (TPR) repeat protein
VWLNNLATRCANLGQREDALAAAEEALRLGRALADSDPDTFADDLASSLNNVATILSVLGRREDALAAAEGAAELYRALAADRPDVFTVDLSMSLGMFTDIRIASGDKAGALESVTEAIKVSVHLPLSGRTMEFGADGICAAGC